MILFLLYVLYVFTVICHELMNPDLFEMLPCFAAKDGLMIFWEFTDYVYIHIYYLIFVIKLYLRIKFVH